MIKVSCVKAHINGESKRASLGAVSRVIRSVYAVPRFVPPVMFRMLGGSETIHREGAACLFPTLPPLRRSPLKSAFVKLGAAIAISLSSRRAARWLLDVPDI